MHEFDSHYKYDSSNSGILANNTLTEIVHYDANKQDSIRQWQTTAFKLFFQNFDSFS